MSCQLIATDIYEFAEMLVSHNILQDARNLFETSSRLFSAQNELEWSYECGSLKFSIEGAISGSIPHKIRHVDIIFSIVAIGIFSEDEICRNPLKKLNFDIELEGFREIDDKIDNYFASWHLDKHIKGPQSSYIHPEYHLSFGGNKLENKGVDNFGSTLILSTPRIPYPPMDVILGIDFILKNFFPYDKISKLLDESKYKSIVFNSQQRLWKPYYLSLYSAWTYLPGTTFEHGFEHFDLNPHLIKI